MDYKRTGIKERRLAEENEVPSDLGARAAEVAIQKSGNKKEEIDLIICAAVTPDFYVCLQLHV